MFSGVSEVPGCGFYIIASPLFHYFETKQYPTLSTSDILNFAAILALSVNWNIVRKVIEIYLPSKLYHLDIDSSTQSFSGGKTASRHRSLFARTKPSTKFHRKLVSEVLSSKVGLENWILRPTTSSRRYPIIFAKQATGTWAYFFYTLLFSLRLPNRNLFIRTKITKKR